MRKLISSGSPMEEAAGYSRAVVQGDFCFVAGTTGYDYETMEMPESIEAQTRNALSTIERTLTDAGFGLADIARVKYYITDAADAGRVFPVVGEFFAEVRPAATMVVTGLIRPEMRIEIEATAYKPKD
ncbi:RidA family protein [Hoeflea prorocentri]|uniref:RidA family protein n=1 Tax=Hoeflea prorocentri TaxID=1922333 RepID=A0A9X3UPV9_9HYPH|nr:RidA family protein [Hoeflea prorocentri]MCY6383194.1 RidA family protein [Hoeflea prorocentri]MDA5400994.1 RidA family protein [Hoeflea prorocentri]